MSLDGLELQAPGSNASAAHPGKQAMSRKYRRHCLVGKQHAERPVQPDDQVACRRVWHHAIGQQTPPVASVLLTACSVSGCGIGEVMRYNWWFVLAMFIVLQIVTYVPAIALFLPNLLIV